MYTESVGPVSGGNPHRLTEIIVVLITTLRHLGRGLCWLRWFPRSSRTTACQSPAQLSHTLLHSPPRDVLNTTLLHSPRRDGLTTTRHTLLHSPPRDVLTTIRQTLLHSPPRDTLVTLSSQRCPHHNTSHSPTLSSQRYPRHTLLHSPLTDAFTKSVDRDLAAGVK